MIRFENVFDPQRVSEPQPVVSATNGGPQARFQGRARQRRIHEREEAVPAERAFQRFNAKSKFANRQRALGRDRATTEALQVFGQ
jgi:hypothetical protein